MATLLRMAEGAFNIKQLLGKSDDRVFVIRPPQRRFKWRNSEIDQLWDDLKRAHSVGRPSYFLGTLLLAPLGDNQSSVIDGQQRITALSLLLAILRDHCALYEESKNRAYTIREYLSRVDSDFNPGPLRVTLQDPDHIDYAQLVDEAKSSNGTTLEKGLLAQAAKRLTGHVRNYLNVPDPAKQLLSLCTFLEDKVQFLVIELEDEGQGYLLFDTTNTRGLKLSPAEALKGRLATIAREDQVLSRDLIEKWNNVASKLEVAGLPINAMDDYLHILWSSKEGHTPKTRLHRIA